MFTANIYTPLGMEWFYYNFTAVSFYTKKLCLVDFIRFNLNFIHKNDKFSF